MEPTPQRLSLANGRCLAGEDEKRGLESILPVCLVVQHAVADLQHHRAVAEQERVKGGLVSLAREAPQQLRVGQLAHALVEGDPVDQLQDRAGRALGHRAVPGERKRALHRDSSFRRPQEAVFLRRKGEKGDLQRVRIWGSGLGGIGSCAIPATTSAKFWSHAVMPRGWSQKGSAKKLEPERLWDLWDLSIRSKQLF